MMLSGQQSESYGRKLIFIAQIILVSLTVITALFNLTIGFTEKNLWINILIASFAYIVPSPLSIKAKIRNNNN